MAVRQQGRAGRRCGAGRAALVAVAVVGVVAALGCAGGRKAAQLPEWVADPASVRDPGDYFVAVGQGASTGEAEEAARRAVTEQVAEAVGARRAETSEYRRRVEAAGGDPAISAELLELRDLGSAARVAGFEIIRRHVDERSGQHYALGSLSKARLVAAYETEMRINAALSNRLAAQAESESVTLRRFSLLRAALAAAEAYNDLRFARGRLAGPLTGYDETLNPPKTSVQELRARLATLRSTVAASIESVGPDAVPMVVETAIRSALQRLNVPVRRVPGEGQVRILVTYAVLPVNEQAVEARLVNWRLGVEVVEDQSGRSLATLALDGKTGGRTLADAQAEAARLARIELEPRIEEFLQRTLFEQALDR